MIKCAKSQQIGYLNNLKVFMSKKTKGLKDEGGGGIRGKIE